MVEFDVVLFSYLDRPIFDVYVDGKVGSSTGGYPNTGGSTVSGVRFTEGKKFVSWRLDGPEGMTRNGDTVIAKNRPEIRDVPAGTRFLAVHIYPDETVEFQFSVHYPRRSARGEIEAEKIRSLTG